MKTEENNSIGAQTWLFMEYARDGRVEKLFHDGRCMRWLRYLEGQGLLKLKDAGVGLGVAGLTSKGQSIMCAYPTQEAWVKHVAPIVAEAGDISLESISSHAPARVAFRQLGTVVKWAAIIVPLILGLLKLRSCITYTAGDN